MSTLEQLKEHNDPLELMNAVCRWPDPPAIDPRWGKAVAAACEVAAAHKSELTAANARIAELEIKLAAVGDMAIANWDDKAVGVCDGAVEPLKYKDMLRTLFVAQPARIAELEQDNLWLRQRVCLATAGMHGYYDDGEFQDNRFPAIDWRRDSIENIKIKIERRQTEALAALSCAPQTLPHA